MSAGAADRDLAQLRRENRRRLAGDHRAARTYVTGRPAHLKIELTNYCNLACPICPHSRMKRPHGYMTPELFERIVGEAAPELEFAYLHHLGESLFHPRVGELVRAGRATGAAMGLSTNATFLDERKARALLEAGLDFLVVSLDAATPETYRLVRVGGELSVTSAHVRRLLALKRELDAPTTIVVQLIDTPQNHHEARAFADAWRALGADTMIKEARDWAGQVTLAGAKAPPADDACRMLWTELTVLWDGVVVPCANVFEKVNVLGDLSRQSLDEVWNGAPMQALRAAHLGGRVADVPVCAGCPRHAFDHADFVAVDQLAQRRRTYVRDDLLPRAGLS